MGYRALYREYRPQKFADIVGQQHITRTLQNAISSGRVSHAYLFCGPRGTGKTSTAKVLAKTLNCLNSQAGEPCNQCQNCISTIEGTAVDVIEIDAASNRGIEDIRDLREKVKYSPANGRYRIYIIDEVHMLTAEAFNALLKTLEEPPSHVVFVLATTEPHKVPVTVLSRCQRFDFRRIDVKDMLPRLRQVAESAGLQVEEQALVLIARAAEGGLRDALSILDQGSVFGDGIVTVDDVHNLLGTVREDILSTMAGYLAEANASGALSLVNDLFQQGKDLRLFIKELNTYLRSLMLYLVSQQVPEDFIENEKIKTDARKFTPLFVSKCLEILTRLEYDMKWSSQPRVLLELALVKITTGESDDINTRVDKIEKYLKNINTGKQLAGPHPEIPAENSWPQEVSSSSKEIKNTVDIKQQKQPEENNVPQQNDRNKHIKQSWPSILERVKKLKPAAYGIFREAEVVDVKEQQLTIGFKPQHASFHKVRAEREENRKVFQQALNDVLGGSWSVKIVTLDQVGYQGEKKTAETESPLLKKAIEFFGEDKVVLK
ncbi:DNA polymerase-3 subunit gamma/tau [Desulfohalotomaculum tongense]|uniref:DNA polymerase III subunit gamma/tau n=1 Tax=Desulforadius tongensis TaxID=1216062 RepID=UPI0019596F40|nr:DNA polymerase III subunit gamma/tau [Desulforadius tongensis]MBM7855158.1 DNA polymerase-3 subunit gamma/tau [Desulforadius tongensis]